MLDCFSPFRRVIFLCLQKEQVTKRNAPQLPLVSCATRLVGWPSKLNLAAHTKRELLRDSDSRWPTTPVNPALLGAADGDPEHHATATVDGYKKRIVFLTFQTSPMCVWRESSHSITLSSGDEIRVEGATVRIPRWAAGCAAR